MSHVIELDNVTLCYGTFTALQQVHLKHPEGQILGLLGHNGAGKTTTMKLILGIIQANQGQVRVFDHSPIGPAARKLRQKVGYLPENVSFYNQLTGREVIDYFGRLKSVAAAARHALLERVGIAHAADRRVKTYSKGMRQRLGLAQALLGQPSLLLFDEPTAGLDPLATREFYTLLTELKKQGTTILLSSHVLPGVEKYLDQTIILGQGRVLAAGTLSELIQAAHLPLTIQVRGYCTHPDWRERLAQQGAQFEYVNGTRLELKSRLDDKMKILRCLSAEPQIQDIDIQEPSLESLYAYYHHSMNAREMPL